MPGPRLLDAEEIRRQLDHLPGWRFAGAGLRAAYDAPDFPAAVQLVGDVADEAESMDHHPDVDLRWRTVRFACSTHSAGGVTQLDVELAHRIQSAAAGRSAQVTAAPARGWELALDVVDVPAVRAFWREALGYVDVNQPDGSVELQDPSGLGPLMWFQVMDPPRTDRDRFHLDVYREGDEAPALRDRLLALGGTLEDDSHAPHWWVVADPEGNLVCVGTA